MTKDIALTYREFFFSYPTLIDNGNQTSFSMFNDLTESQYYLKTDNSKKFYDCIKYTKKQTQPLTKFFCFCSIIKRKKNEPVYSIFSCLYPVQEKRDEKKKRKKVFLLVIDISGMLLSKIYQIHKVPICLTQFLEVYKYGRLS